MENNGPFDDLRNWEGDPASHPDFAAWLQWRDNNKVFTSETATREIQSVKARKACARLGIFTLKDLAQWDVNEFSEKGRIGRYDLEICREALHKAGLFFKNDGGPITALN